MTLCDSVLCSSFIHRLVLDNLTQVYLLHKSLSDWLLQPGGRYNTDVDSGHKKLGLSLLADVWAASHRMPSEYCMKYTVLHLCKAGPACAEQLRATLSVWDYLCCCIRSKHGGRRLVALSHFPNKGSNDYVEDTFRWFPRCLGRFEKEPERLEELTMIHCPLASIKFKEAVARCLGPTHTAWCLWERLAS